MFCSVSCLITVYTRPDLIYVRNLGACAVHLMCTYGSLIKRRLVPFKLDKDNAVFPECHINMLSYYYRRSCQGLSLIVWRLLTDKSHGANGSRYLSVDAVDAVLRCVFFPQILSINNPQPAPRVCTALC